LSLRALGYARVAIGIIFLVRTTPLLHLVPGLFENHGGPLYGWPRGELRVAVLGLVLPVLAIKLLVIVRTLGALLFTLGIATRVAGVVAVLAAYLVYAQEPFLLIFTLHGLYLATLLLALTDATAFVALRPTAVRSPRTSVGLLRAFVVSIYAWSAIAKLRPTWLDGTILRALHAEGVILGPDALFTASGARATAIAIVLAEAMLGPLLLLPRTRAIAIVLACAFHAALEVAAHPDVFGWVMVTLVVAAFVTSRSAAYSDRRSTSSPR